MGNPSKITEGSVVYTLGTFDGKNVVYDFPKILIYLTPKENCCSVKILEFMTRTVKSY